MKKLLGLVFCIVLMLSVIPLAANATEILEFLEFTVDPIIIGEAPSTDIKQVSVKQSDLVEIQSIRWEHPSWQTNFKSFTSGVKYKCFIKVNIKDDVDMRFDRMKTSAKINGESTALEFYTGKEKVLRIENFGTMAVEKNAPKAEAGYDKSYEKEFTVIPYVYRMGYIFVDVKVPGPVAGNKPETPYSEKSDYQVSSYKWEGKLDANGAFIDGQDYKLTYKLAITDKAKSKIKFNYMDGEFSARLYDTNKKRTYYAAVTKISDYEATMEYIFYGDGSKMELDAFGKAVPKGQTSPTASKKLATDITINIAEPVAWQKPVTTVEVSAKDADINNAVEVVDFLWDRAMKNTDGTFMQGVSYTCNVVLHLKKGTNMYFDGTDSIVNVSASHDMVQVSEDRQYAVINIAFGSTKSQQQIDKAQAEKEKQPERFGKAVDALKPGESGSVRLKGTVTFLSKPMDFKDPTARLSPGIGYEIIEIIEAMVPSINRENEFYHVVKDPDGVICYIFAGNTKDATLYEYYATGINPDRPYAAKWASQIKIGDAIDQIGTWSFRIKDGKPTYGFNDSSEKLNFYLDKIRYEHADGLKPYTWTSAVATFKAKDGYYFAEKLDLYEYQTAAYNTVGFKRLNDNTVEVYLKAWVDVVDGKKPVITDAMKKHAELVKNLTYTSYNRIATATVSHPIGEYWNTRMKNKDIGEVDGWHVNDFIGRSELYAYVNPVPDKYTASDGILRLSGAKQAVKLNEGERINIADLDLSDDIPGLVGEWCLTTGGAYVPKAYLKDIRDDSYFEGAPGNEVFTPFEFAGGSGTIKDPYLIETADQLNSVRYGMKYHYKLIADIDLSKWGNWVPLGGTPGYGHMGGNWNKVHNGAWAFQGSFDGNGHVISGMTIVVNEKTPFMTESVNSRAFGLFANLATNPDEYKIKNLGVVDFNIDVTYSEIKKEVDIWAGGICGGMNNGTDIYNCYTKNGKIKFNVTAKLDKDPNAGPLAPKPEVLVNMRIGGICSGGGGVFVGNSRGLTHIEKCCSDTDITVNVKNTTHHLYVGGIMGTIDTTHIQECYNTGDITLPLSAEVDSGWLESLAGGICAFASIPEIPGIYHTPVEKSSLIQNCYNTGSITARSANGIFGFCNSDIYIENCYNVGKLKGNATDTKNGVPAENQTLTVQSAVTSYGKEFVKNCYSNGNSVSGSAWQSSSKLGRKVLKSIPEDSQSAKYSFKPAIIGDFTDVSADAWFASSVRWAVNAKITTGTTPTAFSPNATCTKAQILTFLWRAVGSPSSMINNPFSDVKKTDYYYGPALWAYEKGLVSGTKFEGNTPCTRSATVVYLWKNAGSPKATYNGTFTDVAKNADYATAVAWAVEKGITTGTTPTTFSPGTTCTRGQIVTFLNRAL